MHNLLTSVVTCFVIMLSLHTKASGSLFDANKTYSSSGSLVRYIEIDADTAQYRVAHFENKWYTVGQSTPKFYPNNGPWKQVSSTLLVDENPLHESVSGVVELPRYHQDGTYTGGLMVQFESNCYRAKWWTTSSPQDDENVWELVVCPSDQQATLPALNGENQSQTNETTDGDEADENLETDDSAVEESETDSSTETSTDTTTEQDAEEKACNADNIPAWSAQGTYVGGNLVTHHQGNFYRAKWWNQEEPPLTPPAQAWTTPWMLITDCSGLENNDTDSSAGIDEGTDTNTGSEEGDTSEPTVPVTTDAPMDMPDEGYAFLRLLTDQDWDWLFPLRSGKFVSKAPCLDGQTVDCGGGIRNDGSGDIFTLAAFIKAVLEYNQWAALNGYKEFLNEGTLKQQAQEFITFWAKSSRETSGSWSTAGAPWILEYTIGSETIWAWKGGLYWVEEMGYSTDPATGKSPAINYVDAGSTLYPPAPGRSYYGRGIIQLSWNYNYGAFSYWLYDNGLFKDVIDSRDKLLRFPNLVADHGALSIMSGIWFWMTAQGAKPSSHDVMYGNVSNISQTTQQQGLPQSNSLNSAEIPAASGDTIDQAVYAYRIGTVTNIVNGGLECNKAASYHQGPVQRAFYYDAYAAYFNDKYQVNAVRIDDVKASSKGVWSTSVTDAAPLNLQSVTCYNQRSYYGW